jgi:predicted nucleic acid-binding protein
MVKVASFQKKVFLDTAPLIYFIEGHSQYQEILAQIFKANEAGSFTFITSSITLLEVLVKPLKEGNQKLADQYKNILTAASGIEIIEITTDIAVKAAELRAKHNLHTPDAIQMATAILNDATYFITNDARLKAVKGINSLTLSEIE